MALGLLHGVVLCLGMVVLGESLSNPPAAPDRYISYFRDVVSEVPWSIHVVKVKRSCRDLAFCTTLGKGKIIGMGTVSEQLETLPPLVGQPLAAINGDFYSRSERYQGRPRDVQIRLGELVSSPAGHTSFWLDPQGNPHMTNVTSRLHVIWPDAKTTPIGLNEEREDGAAVLYTTAVGASTRTEGGVELILEAATNSAWLPLRVGKGYTARVKAVRNSGDTPVEQATMVLSLGSSLVSKLPAVRAGDTVQVITDTIPDLTGVEIAIGGGPALVHEGQAMKWNGVIHLRHPRTALGWDKEWIYLVEVDGRQSGLSVGMTLAELADYMIKIGCQEAMNLDGGGSATVWALGKVRNNPSEGQERPSPNALVVVRRKPLLD